MIRSWLSLLLFKRKRTLARKVMGLRGGGLILMVAIFSIGARADDIPVSARADIVAKQIITDVGAKRYADALADIDKYRALAVALPPPLLYEEARLSDITGDKVRTYKAAREFLKSTGRSDPYYSRVVDLYTKYEGDPDVKEKVLADDALAKVQVGSSGQLGQDAAGHQPPPPAITPNVAGRWTTELRCSYATAKYTWLVDQQSDNSVSGTTQGHGFFNGSTKGTFAGTVSGNTIRVIERTNHDAMLKYEGTVDSRASSMDGTYSQSAIGEICSWSSVRD
jgi:hypothetical protein